MFSAQKLPGDRMAQESDELDDDANDDGNDTDNDDNGSSGGEEEQGSMASVSDSVGDGDDISNEQAAAGTEDQSAGGRLEAQEEERQGQEQVETQTDADARDVQEAAPEEEAGEFTNEAEEHEDGTGQVEQSNDVPHSPVAPAPAAAVSRLFSGGTADSVFIIDADAHLWFGYFSFTSSRGPDASAATTAHAGAAGVDESYTCEFDTAELAVSEQLKFRRVSLPFKVTCVAAIPIDDSSSANDGSASVAGSDSVGSENTRNSSCSRLRLLLTDGDHGIYWATLTLTQTWSTATTTTAAAVGAAQMNVEVDMQVVVDRCALSSHAAKGACYLTDDCAAVYGDKAISLWMH